MMNCKRRTLTWYVNDRGCHICTSHKAGAQGYPRTRKDGRAQTLHRVIYEEKYGKLPHKIQARHKCDDRMCINLDHIIPGTANDNAQDKIERGRSNHLVGVGVMKFTKKQMKEIYKAMGSLRSIARKFGTTHKTIGRIKREWVPSN